MAIGVRGTSTYASTAADTSFVINKPTGTVDGDVMYWQVQGTTATAPAAPPSGWTLVKTSTTTTMHNEVWRRVASGEPSTFTSSTLTSARYASIVITLSGAHTTTPEDVAVPAVIAGTTTITFTAVTPVTSGAWVFGFGTMNHGAGLPTGNAASSNLTIDVEAIGATAFVNPHAAIGHVAWTSGALTPIMTNSQAMTRSLGMTIAVRPAAVVAGLPILVMAPRTGA